MSIGELLLGWTIVVLLLIGSIVAADPFWRRLRPHRSPSIRADSADRRGVPNAD